MKKPVVQKVVLGAVIFNQDNKILILQRNKDEDIYPNMWELPSGKKEEFEDVDKSLLREVKEETGLSGKILMPFSVFNYKIEKPDEIRDSTQINFLARAKSDKVNLSPEHQNFAWIVSGQINNYKISVQTKNVIRQAFKIIRQFIV